MPLYLYLDNRDGKVYEIVQKMKDEHVAFAEDGYKLERIFTKPTSCIDTKIDINSSKEFVAKTAKRGMTYGEMSDLAAEMSERRGGENDPVRKKSEESYFKKTGKRHPNAKKQEKFLI